MAHPGSWSVFGYRLPDYGITERLTSNKTPQGGSNLIGGNSYAAPQVLGSQTPNYGYTPAPTTYTAPKPTSSGGGGSYSPTTTGAPVSYSVPDPNEEARRQAEEEARRREAETRSAIEGGYNAYTSGLQGLQGSFETSKGEELTSASNVYNQLFGGLTEQKNTNLASLQAGRGAVENRQSQSIKDLQQNLSNVTRNMGMQLGAMGAGDTSAANVMMPYAYTKLAGQQESGIRRQANDQFFQIDQEERNTELEFSRMWQETEIEKENQLQGIKSYYADAIRNVQTAIAQAPLDKARDLASLNQSLLAEAQSNLRQLESEYRQRQENIKSFATQRMTDLNNMKLELSGSANFKPQDIMWSELQMMGAQPTASSQEALYNPLILAQKKREEYLR